MQISMGVSAVVFVGLILAGGTSPAEADEEGMKMPTGEKSIKANNGTPNAEVGVQKPTFIRFKENPIIRPEMMSGDSGENINGPSLIQVPAWLPNPLGKYYLYFAHHKGPYIRLAYADQLGGPWKIYEPGTLSMEEVAAVDTRYRLEKAAHIASPDVHVDNEKQEIRMYFHAQISPHAMWGHKSGVAVSKDGIAFKVVSPRPIGEPYFRVFQWDGYYYTTTRTGNLARSKDGLTNWQEREDTYPLGKQAMGKFAQATTDVESGAMLRHTALKLDGDVLSVFFTRTGDAPESVMLSTVKLSGDWTTWKLSEPIVVLQPEMDYEGANLPVEKSRAGSRLGRGPINGLQSPAIYQENGKAYLLYCVKGEYGIAIAELKD